MESNEFDISKVDRNFASETLGNKPVVWHEIHQAPFRLYGLLPREGRAGYCRMPERIAGAVSGGVASLNTNTAGGRLRFSTDSPYLAIRYTLRGFSPMAHMADTGSRGFDLYWDNARDSVFLRSLGKNDEKNGCYTVFESFSFSGRQSYTLHFPLYANVESLQLGLAPGAFLGEGKSYSHEKPLLFYGSSITQGGCASRPGTCYAALVSRWLDRDHINLGFSGSAKGEEKMMEHLASLHPGVLVYDYDHNASSLEHLQNTHEKGFRIFRKQNPLTPVILVSAPNWEWDPMWYPDFSSLALRREVIFRTYTNAIAAGDENVAFVDGRSFFAERERYASTVDGCHPNDLGMLRMAEHIADAIRPFLRKEGER